MGPIVWPSTGYLQSNNVKVHYRCQRAFIHSVWRVYVRIFSRQRAYGSPGKPSLLSSPPREEGRYEGVKVARAPLSDALNPRAWQVFLTGIPAVSRPGIPSLPQGFTKETMAYFCEPARPKSTVILGTEASKSIRGGRFSVAQVRNTNYFIGIESYTDLADPVPGTPGAYRIKQALRYSSRPCALDRPAADHRDP